MADSLSLLEALKTERKGWEGTAIYGAYFPDTYEVYWNASAEEIAEKIYQNTIKFWSPAHLDKAARLGLSAAEYTLASIVMKESSKTDDRPLVARLYLNRLAKGMSLQASNRNLCAQKKESGNGG